MLKLRRGVARPRFRAGWAGAWGSGCGVMAAGCCVIWLDRKLFPPLPAAMGFLGVLVPLLFFRGSTVAMLQMPTLEPAAQEIIDIGDLIIHHTADVPIDLRSATTSFTCRGGRMSTSARSR